MARKMTATIKRRVLQEDVLLTVRVPQGGLIVEAPRPVSEYQAEALREATEFQDLAAKSFVTPLPVLSSWYPRCDSVWHRNFFAPRGIFCAWELVSGQFVLRGIVGEKIDA
jgi:hypothetical protein